jgi:hypothetical protein
VDVPYWWEAALLALATWRIFNLLAHDKITDRLRRWFLNIPDEWEKEGDPVGEDFRLKWALFLICPYCAGFWIGLVWWLSWQVFPHATLVVAVPFALNAGVIALAKILTPEEE